MAEAGLFMKKPVAVNYITIADNGRPVLGTPSPPAILPPWGPQAEWGGFLHGCPGSLYLIQAKKI